MTAKVTSILIATYNRSCCLHELLGRLVGVFGHELAQGTLEILVFNDASTDDTAQVCVDYGAHIRYLSTSENVGYIEGRRRLIAAARGDYLVSLDDDSCFLDDDALEQIRAAFTAYPACGALAANIASPRSPGGQAPIEIPPMAVDSFIGCGHVLRAECVRCIGSYPDFLTGYGAEEAALSLRLLDQGYQIWFLPSLRVYHARDSTRRSVVKERAQAFANNLAIVVYAYPLWLILPTVAKKTMSRVLFDARHGSLGAIGLSTRRLPMAIGKALRQRRPIRFQTLRQFFALRQAVFRQGERWRLMGWNPDEAWPETKTMFVHSSAGVEKGYYQDATGNGD